jgi:hypothetical protein
MSFITIGAALLAKKWAESRNLPEQSANSAATHGAITAMASRNYIVPTLVTHQKITDEEEKQAIRANLNEEMQRPRFNSDRIAAGLEKGLHFEAGIDAERRRRRIIKEVLKYGFDRSELEQLHASAERNHYEELLAVLNDIIGGESGATPESLVEKNLKATKDQTTAIQEAAQAIRQISQLLGQASAMVAESEKMRMTPEFQKSLKMAQQYTDPLSTEQTSTEQTSTEQTSTEQTSTEQTSTEQTSTEQTKPEEKNNSQG